MNVWYFPVNGCSEKLKKNKNELLLEENYFYLHNNL